MLSALNRILPLPYPHFMAFAPLDVWFRLLTRGRAFLKIPPRFYLRLLAALSTSALATILTLPERLLLAPILALTYRKRTATTPPDVLIILGYFRSGTTHLHYMLSCDPRLSTPRWYQMLAPQGFFLSWTFLRYFLVPFLSSKRPQDDVAYGPEYPAEDDFGVCNLSAACTMPGRMAVPHNWDDYKGFQTLDPASISAADAERFRRAQWSLTRKLAWLAPSRILLLKSPPHTGKVRELLSLYGPNARFIHLHRDPTPVLRSNVAMHARFDTLLLQPHPGDDEIRRRIIDEYNATEFAFLAQQQDVAPNRLVRLRYEDVITDPISALAHAYQQLELDFTPEFAQRLIRYLDTVRDYRAASDKTKSSTSKTDDRAAAQVPPADELNWMLEAFHHKHPPIPKRDPRERAHELCLLPRDHDESPDNPATAEPLFTAPLAALIAACFGLFLIFSVAYFTGARNDWIIWPIGALIGLSALNTTKSARGTPALGLLSALFTLAVFALAAYPVSWLTDYVTRDPLPWDHVWLTTKRNATYINTLLWLTLGTLTAYRYASREHVRPPGL